MQGNSLVLALLCQLHVLRWENMTNSLKTLPQTLAGGKRCVWSSCHVPAGPSPLTSECLLSTPGLGPGMSPQPVIPYNPLGARLVVASLKGLQAPIGP